MECKAITLKIRSAFFQIAVLYILIILTVDGSLASYEFILH